jgi:hypothetical protein
MGMRGGFGSYRGFPGYFGYGDTVSVVVALADMAVREVNDSGLGLDPRPDWIRNSARPAIPLAGVTFEGW